MKLLTPHCIAAAFLALNLSLNAQEAKKDEPAKPAPPTAPAESPKPAAETPKTETAKEEAPGDVANPASCKLQAPESFKVKLETTKGDIIIKVVRTYSPNGADRFYNLVKAGFFKDIAFFRVIPGFMGQFGIHGDPALAAKWKEANIPDDPVRGSNVKGAITFAKAGPNTRSTQFFINLVDNANLDRMGFPPFGKVIEGMDVMEKINGEYGEGAPQGKGPEQGRIQAEGNAYLKKDFPNLDYIKSASVVE